MHLERVRAEAFGALVDADLVLGPGLNVVVGPNESGKSTWHAACTAVLTGVRRGRGKRRADDERLARRHQPWEGERWAVSADVVTADGRRLDVRHDLVTRTGEVRDAATGAALTGELQHDGATDPSLLVGLDRRALVATASVRQADLRWDASDADALQHHLQRAATELGGSGTAGEALDRIARFRGERVGGERANSMKPLMSAVRAREHAVRSVDDARRAHDDRRGRVADVRRLRREADHAADAAVHARRRWAAARAAELRAWLRYSDEEGAAFPDGPPPEPDHDLDGRVADARAHWSGRAEPVSPPPRSSVEVEAELRALPSAPTHPTAVAAEVVEAVTDLAAAERSWADAREAARPAPVWPCPPDETTALRRALAAEEAPSQAGVGLATAVVLALVVAGAGAAVGSAAVTVVGGLAAAAALAGWWRHRRDRAAVESSRRWAIDRLTGLGLPVTTEGLDRAAADHRAEVDLAGRLAADLVARRDAVERARRWADEGLDRHGAPPGPTPAGRLDSLRAACEEAAHRAATASQRPGLERELAHARHVEEVAARAAAAHRAAVDALADAVEAVGGPEGLAAGDADEWLGGWQVRRRGQRVALAAARDRWLRLAHHRRTRPDAEVRAELTRVEAELATLGPHPGGHGGDTDSVAERTRPGDDAGVAHLERAAVEAERRAERAARAAGEAAATLEGLRSVGVPLADAEADLHEADRALGRLRTLAHTLDETGRLLTAARDAAHRDIAPRLAARIGPPLATVTAGRYDAVLVDPADLTVRVRSGPRWVESDRLSHGTAEQVHLLARIALADALVAPGETVPLLLDDVTVHADAERAAALCELLGALATERQVVVFTQERAVAGALAGGVTGGGGCLVELTPAGSAIGSGATAGGLPAVD